jgi:hypothetical protein
VGEGIWLIEQDVLGVICLVSSLGSMDLEYHRSTKISLEYQSGIKKRYGFALFACGLEEDLSCIPGGDLSMAGSNEW